MSSIYDLPGKSHINALDAFANPRQPRDLSNVSLEPGEYVYVDDQFLPLCAAGMIPGFDKSGNRIREESLEPKERCAEKKDEKKDDDDDDKKGGQSIQFKEEPKRHPHNLRSVAKKLRKRQAAAEAITAAAAAAAATAAAAKKLREQKKAAKKLRKQENAAKKKQDMEDAAKKLQEFMDTDIQCSRDFFAISDAFFVDADGSFPLF